ncbi:hypothetical protein [Pseudarthrobacter sp. NS4]|uniref:hypothetical protein n=1 Tax=Pseudarthrobacter sp. NS4 TaxID=2973976 RepID=UPI0021630596|nr:hypothetical protein [Pseudarthrobacter sp. NS4]
MKSRPGGTAPSLPLGADDMTVDERALVKDARSPPSLPLSSRNPVEARLLTQPVPEQAAAPSDGAVSLTIPLQITVRVGAVQAAQQQGQVPAGQNPIALPGSAAVEEAVAIDPDYSGRRGYDPDFLGTPVPLPVLTAEQRTDAAQNRRPANGQDPTVLNYHHSRYATQQAPGALHRREHRRTTQPITQA